KRDWLHVTARRDLQDLRIALDREGVEVRYIEVAVGRDDRRDDMALASADVGNPADLPAGGDAVELPVVRLDGVQGAAVRDHAVPGAVRLEIRRKGICDGVRHLESAQIGNEGRRVVA